MTTAPIGATMAPIGGSFSERMPANMPKGIPADPRKPPGYSGPLPGEPRTGDPVPKAQRDKPAKRAHGRPSGETRAASRPAIRTPQGEAKPAPDPIVGDGPEPAPQPRGPQKRKGAPPSGKDVDTLAAQIVGYHMLAAGFMRFPPMAVTLIEARVLAESILTCQEEFGLEVSPKTAAIMGLIGAALMVEGPRLYAYSLHLANLANGVRPGTVLPQPRGHGPAPTAPPGGRGIDPDDGSGHATMNGLPLSDGPQAGPGPVPPQDLQGELPIVGGGTPQGGDGGAGYVNGHATPPIEMGRDDTGQHLVGGVPLA